MSGMLFRYLFSGPSKQTQTDPMFSNRKHSRPNQVVENSLKTFPVSGMCACMHMHDGQSSSLFLLLFFPGRCLSNQGDMNFTVYSQGWCKAVSGLDCLRYWSLERFGFSGCREQQSAEIHSSSLPDNFVGQRSPLSATGKCSFKSSK